VVFGKASGFDPSVNLSTLNGTSGFKIASPSGVNSVSDAATSMEMALEI
jgi:hypothetical protein